MFLKEIIATHKQNIIITISFILITILSFGLGYLSNKQTAHAPIIIEKCAKTTR